jgi:hypothetical protein
MPPKRVGYRIHIDTIPVPESRCGGFNFVCLPFCLGREGIRQRKVGWQRDQICSNRAQACSVLSKGFSHCSPIPPHRPISPPNLSPFSVPIRQLSSRRPRRCRPQCKLSQLTLCRHINGLPSLVSSTGTPPCCLHPPLEPESANVPISTQSLTPRYKKSTQTVDSEKSSSSKTLHHLPQLLPRPPPARTAILRHTSLLLILLR